MQIRQIPISAILRYQKEAEKAQLVFCTQTVYYGLFVGLKNDILAGFAGIRMYGNKVVMKNDYIFPEYRKKGYNTKLLKYRLQITRGVKAEATCTPMSLSLYLKQGFREVKKFKNGCTLVRRENL